MDTLYFAYGSNINLNQMAFRCPDATVIGPVTLENYELLFRGNGDGFGVATIEPKEGGKVFGLLWNITPDCEKSLDRYEGYPHLYDKQTVTVRDGSGKTIPVMAYVMTREWTRLPTVPSKTYYNGIQDGFRQNNLPTGSLRDALIHVWDETEQLRRQMKKQKKKGQER